MKIAFIVPRLVNKGPIIVVRDLIEQIKTSVDLIDVYHFGDESEVVLNANAKKISFSTAFDFSKYDVVHSHMLKPDAYVFYHRKSFKGKTRFVSTVHQNIIHNLTGDYNYIAAIIIEKIWLRFLKRFDHIVTLTRTQEKEYAGKVKKVGFSTIYNGRAVTGNNQEIENYREVAWQIAAFKKQYTVIGMHCVVTKRKGIDQVLKAMVHLKDYGFLLMGDGKELANLRNLAQTIGIANRCLFLGYIKNAAALLPLFDMYVMASSSEGFPLALLEAGLAGLPVVCSDIPIFQELFGNDEVSFFTPYNTHSLADAIKRAEANKVDLSRKLRSKILESYSIEAMGNAYYKLYKKLTIQG